MTDKKEKRYAISLTPSEWKNIFRILRQTIAAHPVDDSLLADAMEKDLVEQMPETQRRRFTAWP